MDNVKTDSYYTEKAIGEIDAIAKYTEKARFYDDFVSDPVLVDAVLFRLIQLIEYLKNISDEFKKNHREIPWGQIIGFRNGLVHDYGDTDYKIVFEIVDRDIYELKKALQESLK